MRTALLYTCLLVSACDSGLENVNPPAVAENEHASPSKTTPNALNKLQVEASASALPAAVLPGGETTFIELSPLSPKSAAAFSQPSANLDSKGRRLFVVGNSFFTKPWVTAGASTAGRDGLGPLFSAAACQDCHIRDGRGQPPVGSDDPINSAAIRIALPNGEPDPIYGPHIQSRSVPGLATEAKVRLTWLYHQETLPDGTSIELRQPKLQMSDWAYGAPQANLQAGLRIAPTMIGMGLLEAIPEADIKHYAQQQKALGLNGITQDAVRLNEQAETLGRFGWKARQPNVRQQSLDAFINDIGITSSLFPAEVCSQTQLNKGCADMPSGGSPELTEKIEAALVFYARHLAPPVRRGHQAPEVQAGEALFKDLGCAACHKPSWRTAETAASTALANQLIWPYTDLLLHDMGKGLADNIVEGKASGRHWRTAPLWGLGQTKAVGGENTGYLHDGRARTLAEAILWHGGEAKAARDGWAALGAEQRRQVIAFLGSL